MPPIKYPPSLPENFAAKTFQPKEVLLGDCCWCDKPAKTRDHIIPLWVFRLIKPRELIEGLPRAVKPSCIMCNGKKGPMPPAQFERAWADTDKRNHQAYKEANHFWSSLVHRLTAGTVDEVEMRWVVERMREPLRRAALMVPDAPTYTKAAQHGPWLAREQYLRLKREQHKSTHPTLGVVWPQRFDPYCGPWLSNLRWKELQAWRERRDRRALTKLALTKADAFSQQLDELMLQHEQGPDRPRYGDQHEEA